MIINSNMLTEARIQQIIKQELNYHASHASGKGGQNVNKVETKVGIEWDVLNSVLISDDEKQLIISKCRHVNKEGVLKLASETHRTQLQNKKEVIAKLISLLKKLFVKPKKRLATKPSKASKLKKAKDKKVNKEKKLNRKKPII